MKSSGIKRTMAVFAISAVAVAGIPALATANTIDSQVTGAISPIGVQLYNESFGGFIDLTAKADGTDSTVRLEAGGGINVAQVTFQVRRNGIGAFADIATVSRNDDGAFSTEWTPATNGAFAGDTIEIRALNTAVPAQQDTAGGFTLQNATANTTQAINIATGSQKGYFEDPDSPPGTVSTVGVTGTTTVNSILPGDAPVVSWKNGAGAIQNPSFDTSNSGDGTFEGVLTVTTPPYVFDDPTLPPAEADQLVVHAFTNTGVGNENTDDHEAFTLYKQTLTSLTVTIAPSEEPDPDTATLTVLDQSGNPIAGIDIYARLADGTFVGGGVPTDGRGQLVIDVPETALYFYANADSNDAFSPGAGDKRSPDVNTQAASVTIRTTPSEGAQPVGTTVTETVTVRDANGDPISNRDVRFKQTGPGGQAATVTKTTNSSGVVTYTFGCNIAGVATIDVGIRGPVPPLADPFSFATARDTVQCGIGQSPKKAINPSLKSKNTASGDDRLTVRAKAANGAAVKIYKLVGGKQVLVKSGKLNANGVLKVNVNDTNGRNLTTYKAVVSPTSDTRRGVTNRAQQAKTL